jgi:dihydrofolate reductase
MTSSSATGAGLTRYYTATSLDGFIADAGLLDEVIVYIAPLTLGAGAPLLSRRIELRLEELGRNGEFACARYAVVRPAG